MNQKFCPPSGQKIFQAIFGSVTPSDRVLKRYELSVADHGFGEREEALAQSAIASVGDIESFEFAARVTRRLPVLSYRFRLMVAIAECEPTMRNRFVATEDRQGFAVLILLTHALKSLLKLVKGLVLLKIFLIFNKNAT